MSNIISSFLAATVSVIFASLIYSIVKKWSKFHIGKIGKVLKVIYILLLLFSLIISLSITYTSFVKYWEDDRLQVWNELDGIKLHWSSDEVVFRKGMPKSSEKRDDSLKVFYPEGDLNILYTDKKVWWISKACGGFFYKKFGGVGCNDSVEDIIQAYGVPKKLEISEDKLSRLYCYPKYQICFFADSGKVSGVIVTQSKGGGNGVSFISSAERKRIDEQSRTKPVDSKIVPQSDLPKPENKAHLVPDEDHCAPGISKAERLRRLALKGVVRQTGSNTYTTGNNEVSFYTYDGSLLDCR